MKVQVGIIKQTHEGKEKSLCKTPIRERNPNFTMRQRKKKKREKKSQEHNVTKKKNICSSSVLKRLSADPLPH